MAATGTAQYDILLWRALKLIGWSLGGGCLSVCGSQKLLQQVRLGRVLEGYVYVGAVPDKGKEAFRHVGC